MFKQCETCTKQYPCIDCEILQNSLTPENLGDFIDARFKAVRKNKKGGKS